eukprot:750825-Prymnesium_polylepis.2
MVKLESQPRPALRPTANEFTPGCSAGRNNTNPMQIHNKYKHTAMRLESAVYHCLTLSAGCLVVAAYNGERFLSVSPLRVASASAPWYSSAPVRELGLEQGDEKRGF